MEGEGTVTLSGSNIQKNSADRGGAIYMNQSGKVELTGGTINENKANIDGGAVYIKDGTVDVYKRQI